MTDPAPAANEATPTGVVTDMPFQDQGEPGPGVVESPATEQPNSPQPGESSPAPQVEPGPAPLLAAPTEQPPLPGPAAFDGHGKPDKSVVPAVRQGTYVDADGQRLPCTIVAKRKDGSVDIMVTATIGGYRRDAVRRKLDDTQTGDYLE